MFEVASFVLALTVITFINWLLYKKLKETEYMKICILLITTAVLLPFLFYGANCRLVNIGLILSLIQLNGVISLIAVIWILLKRTKQALWARCVLLGTWLGLLIVIIPALFVLQLIVFC